MSKSRKTGWWTKERQQYAYDRLTQEAKLSDAGARGLVSRWSNVEAHAGPTAKNPTSGAHGIGQWLGDRKKALGGSVDFTVQIDHAIRELNGKEKKAGDLLRNAQTAEQGAMGASAYERAEGYNARTKRDNFTRATMAGMSRVAASDTAAPELALAETDVPPPAVDAVNAMATGGLLGKPAAAKQGPQFGPPQNRPFNPGETRPNPDGSYSTEISMTAQRPNKQWENFPSLWQGPQGPVQFTSEDQAQQAANNYEKFGYSFPSFDTLGQAEAAAEARSKAGGVGVGLLAKPNSVGGLLGKPSVDIAETPEQIDAATVQQATQQALQKAKEVAQPTYSVNNTPATPEQRMGEMIDMPGMTDFERSVNAQSAAKFNPDAVKAAGLSRLGPPETDVASMPGGIRAAASVPSPGEAFADPFGNYQPGGIMAKSTAPKMQNSLTNPETATGPTVMSPVQQSTPTEARVTPSMQEDRFTREQAPQVASADPNAAFEAAHPVNTAFDDQYEAAVAAPDLSAPTDVPDYTVADAEQAPEEPTIGEYPATPEPSFTERNPRLTSTVKDMAKGLMMGGLPGAALGGIGGLMAGRLGPGFDAAVPEADRFSVGSGLPGIMAAKSGPYGATATSTSNPGWSFTKANFNQGLQRSNKYGWTEVVGPDGSVVGIQYDDPDKKGLLGSISRRAGGLLGGRGGGLSKGSRDAIDKGQGGLY